MKKIPKTIQVDAYTDDGVPVCGECRYCRGEHVIMSFVPRAITRKPGPGCQIWRKQDNTGVEEDLP